MTTPGTVQDTRLRRECNLTENSEIADIGSGTGILARMFLDNGNRVVMVEPNDDMRHAGERLLSWYGRLDSVAATAEATGLSESSVDFVTVGQAFHWFDPVAAREEFTRVLRPGGRVVSYLVFPTHYCLPSYFL